MIKAKSTHSIKSQFSVASKLSQAKRTIPVIGTETFGLYSSSVCDHELIPYDSIKYRSNPSESKWEGKRIVSVPSTVLAIIARKGTDEKGDFISLLKLVPKAILLAAA